VTDRQRDVASSVSGLITIAAMTASAFMVAAAPGALDAVLEAPVKTALVAGFTLALQLFSVEIYGRGSLSVSAIGIITAAFLLGPGPAMALGFVAALIQWLRKRGALHRAVFDAANLAMSAGAAGLLYDVIDAPGSSLPVRFAAALAAGFAYNTVNIGLVTLAMSLSEGDSILVVWRERFRWATFHFLSYGPVALAAAMAYENAGFVGLLAFVLPPVLIMSSVRQYLERTRVSVEEVRAANLELRSANDQLAATNEDLHALFQFAGGLSATAHDQSTLVSYAEEAIARLTGARARVSPGSADGAIPLVAGGGTIGSLDLAPGVGYDEERWGRLREAILPQLATALESAQLVEQVRKTHLATIAALSRSMEAKDYYTGGHTERVSGIAVSLAARLGYSGTELDAIEIGALLHDIGKIGIPERILHKPGPLDDDEWKVMKEHPIISEYILSGVDLPPIVLEIARSSHERMDGKGYPDGKRGEEIPLPARIVLVADAFDALTSDRPYRRARSLPGAVEEIRAHAGTQFCPRVVNALDALYREEPHVLGAGRLTAVETLEGAA
jgi:hypothetical protein